VKILILGATGRTGKYLLELALNQGFEVNILVRNAQNVPIKSKKLEIFEGLGTNIEDLKKAANGCKIIISALNISRNSDFPWARLRTPQNFLSLTVQNIITLQKSIKIEKVIVISAWGVAETKKDIPYWFKTLIDWSNIKYGYLEHENQEKLLKNSTLNWTSVRPVGLTNFKKMKPIIISFENFPKPNLTISRKNVARFIIENLHNKHFDNQVVTISEK
jgi:uncharacterized protein YbjT (DUF2867 family)